MKHKFLFLKTFLATRWFRRFRNRRQLVAYQERQLTAYYAFLRQASPYFQKHDPAQFSGMNKAFMMAYFNELNTQGVDRDAALSLALESERTRDFTIGYQQVAVGLSSGTSGHRGLFITTEQERTMWAASILAKMLPKGQLFGHRIAFFLRADNTLYQTIQSKLIHLAYFDMTQELPNHLHRLNQYQPTILVAPASMLLALAKEKDAGRLDIAPIKIISVAEILEEADRRTILASFSLPVLHQIYQATEGFLASSCSHGTLHINEDIIRLEKRYLDERRFYPIITDFMRHSQPILSYELNDILVEKTEACPCGSLFTCIEKIEGRSDDIFSFEGENQQEVRIFPDFIRRCFLFVDQIGEYQARQLSPTQIKIAIANRTPAIEAALTKEFATLAATHHFIMPQLIFSDYHWDKQVKLKRVVNQIQQKETL